MLDSSAKYLDEFNRDDNNTSKASNILTDILYSACKSSYKHPVVNRIPQNQRELKSKNSKAIAEINLFTYEQKIKANIPFDECSIFLSNWDRYEQLAKLAETVEMNTKQNSGWKNMKRDGKSLWKVIDWNGNCDKKQNKTLSESQIQSYFKNIFQA